MIDKSNSGNRAFQGKSFHSGSKWLKNLKWLVEFPTDNVKIGFPVSSSHSISAVKSLSVKTFLLYKYFCSKSGELFFDTIRE